MFSNFIAGESAHFDYADKNSSSERPKKKKSNNKKKSSKQLEPSSELRMQVQLNDASTEYPTSRVIKQSPNGDVIVQEISEDDGQHYYQPNAYDDESDGVYEDEDERWAHHQCSHEGDHDDYVHVHDDEEHDGNHCPHHHHHHHNEDEEDGEEEEEEEEEEENNHHHRHHHHHHDQRLRPSVKSMQRQQQIIQQHAKNPVYGNYLWNSNTPPAEKEKIKQFWVSLPDERKRSIIQISKDEVMKVIREEQKVSCNCKACGNRKITLERELEKLYYGYYNVRRLASGSEDEPNVNKGLIDSLLGIRPNHQSQLPHSHDHEDRQSSIAKPKPSISTSNNGVKSVAEDLLRNDGKKFIDMVEQLDTERNEREQLQSIPGAFPTPDHNSEYDYGSTKDEGYESEEDEEEEEDSEEEEEDGEEDSDEGYTNDDEGEEKDYDDEEDEDAERRLEETYKMLQLITSKILRSKLMAAYKEKVAEDSTRQLIEELEAEEKRKKAKEEKERMKKEKLKEKKRQQQLAKEEEKRKKEEEKLEQERILRDEQKRKTEEGRKKKETERKKREEEQKRKKEELKKKKEAEQERLRKEREDKEQKRLEEKKRREEEFKKKQEIKLQKEIEKKERETKRLEEEALLKEHIELQAQVDAQNEKKNISDTPKGFESQESLLSEQRQSSTNSQSIQQQQQQLPSLPQSFSDDQLNQLLMHFGNHSNSNLEQNQQSIIQPPPGIFSNTNPLPSVGPTNIGNSNGSSFGFPNSSLLDISMPGLELNPTANPSTSSPWSFPVSQSYNVFGSNILNNGGSTRHSNQSMFSSPFVHSQGQLHQQIKQTQIGSHAQTDNEVNLLSQYISASHMSDSSQNSQQPSPQQTQPMLPHLQQQQSPAPVAATATQTATTAASQPSMNGFVSRNNSNPGLPNPLGAFNSGNQSSLLGSSTFFNNELSTNAGSLTADTAIWGTGTNSAANDVAANCNSSIWGPTPSLGGVTPQVTNPLPSLWNNTSTPNIPGAGDIGTKKMPSNSEANGGFNQLSAVYAERVQIEAFAISGKIPKETNRCYSVSILHHYTRQASLGYLPSLTLEQFLAALSYPLGSKIGVSFEIIFDELANPAYVKVTMNGPDQQRQVSPPQQQPQQQQSQLSQLNGITVDGSSVLNGVDKAFNSSLLGVPSASPFGMPTTSTTNAFMDKGLLDTWGTGFR